LYNYYFAFLVAIAEKFEKMAVPFGLR